jgi:hypothetical protein
LVEILDYLVSAIGLIGLFGFAYRRRIWRRRIWMLWGVLLPVWSIVMGLWVYPRQNGTGVQMMYFLVLPLAVPQYLALIRYGYRSPELWSDDSGRSAGQPPI